MPREILWALDHGFTGPMFDCGARVLVDGYGTGTVHSWSVCKLEGFAPLLEYQVLMDGTERLQRCLPSELSRA